MIDAYSNVLLQHGTGTMSRKTSTGETKTLTTYSKYAIYDINKDNSPELLVDDANDNMLYVYSFKNSRITSWCGYVASYGADSYYEYPNGNGIIMHGGGMGHDHFEGISKYVFRNEELYFDEELANTEYGTFKQLRDSLDHYKKIVFKETNDLSFFDNLKIIKVVLNGEEIEFDQSPIMAEGNRILVPIRKIAEAMGDKVLWNQDTQSAFIKHGEVALIIKLLENNIKIVKNEQLKQWQKKQLDVPAMVLNERTLVPVRAFCESLGADVKWVGEEKTVYMTYNFNNKTKEMDGETFRNINTVYYALNNKATQFDTYSDDFNEFYDQRNHTVDGLGMGVSDIWAGVNDLLSGLSNAENIMKYSLEQMLISIPDNDIVVIDKELADDIKEYAEKGKDIFDEINGIDDDFLKLHPELKSLDNSIDKLGKAYDAISFSTEQLEVILSNYTMNIDYLYTLKDSLKKSGMLNDKLEASILSLEEEYSSKFLQILMNIQNKVVQEGISAIANTATGGVFGIGNFVWDTIFSATDVTEKGKALKTFYGLYCINGSLDKSYKDLFKKILSGNYTSNDVTQLKQLDDMQRALKITTYNSIENITNDKATQEYCIKTIATLSKNCMLWQE